jgi:hypothetical protein
LITIALSKFILLKLGSLWAAVEAKMVDEEKAMTFTHNGLNTTKALKRLNSSYFKIAHLN